MQSVFAPFRAIPLAGFEPQPAEVKFEYAMLTSGEFQAFADKKAVRNFGFREVAVRCYNQVLYSLFDETTPQVIAGKDGYLFEAGYRPALCGQDFMGAEAIGKKVDSLEVIRDWLAARDKKLAVLIAPNKWRVHADEELWDCPDADPPTNYGFFKEALTRAGIPLIDGIATFDRLAEESPHPVFSRQGTHWSVYGAYMASLEVCRTLRDQGVHLPEVMVDSMETGGPRYTDKDLHDLLNILRLPRQETLAYPRLSVGTGHGSRVLVIGDSYYWTFYYLGLHRQLFAPGSKFLYYNNSMVLDKPDIQMPATREMKREELLESEVVLLVMSEPSLARFGFGFLQDAARVMAAPEM